MAALKLDDSTRRREMIGALFTKEEKLRIEQTARSRGITPSILVRQAALSLLTAKAEA